MRNNEIFWVSNMNFYITKNKGKAHNGLQGSLRILLIDAERKESKRKGRYIKLYPYL